MFDTDEEKDMLYTLSVNLEYFEREMKRAKEFYGNDERAKSYANIAQMLKFTCSLVKERLDKITE